MNLRSKSQTLRILDFVRFLLEPDKLLGLNVDVNKKRIGRIRFNSNDVGLNEQLTQRRPDD